MSSHVLDQAGPTVAILPVYFVFNPHWEQATMALATCPPGRTSAVRNSTFELKAGNWGRRIMVSVALSPTPATSTMGRESGTRTLYEKTTPEQEEMIKSSV